MTQFEVERRPDGWAVVTVLLRNPPGDMALLAAGLPEGTRSEGLNQAEAEEQARLLERWADSQKRPKHRK